MNTPTVNLASTKPSDFDISRHFIGTFYQNYNAELVARQLIHLSQDGDEWKPITFEEYKRRLGHPEKSDNTNGFDRLVSGGALILKDGAYHFTDRFIAHFKAFIKK